MTSIRNLTAVLAASGALLAAGAPAAPAQSGTAGGDYPTDTTSQTGKKGKKGRRGPRRLSDAQLTKVATALGTDLAGLKAAMAEVKKTVDATDERETRADRDALLAAALGATVDELRAAFGSVRGASDGRCAGKAPASGDHPTDAGTT